MTKLLATHIAAFVLAGCHDFHWGGLGHPLCADFGQQMQIKFIGKQQSFAAAQLIVRTTNAASFEARSASASVATSLARFQTQPSACRQRRTVSADIHGCSVAPPVAKPRWRTPTRAAPTVGGGRFLQHSEKAPSQRRSGTGWPARSDRLRPATPPFTSPEPSHKPWNGRTAERTQFHWESDAVPITAECAESASGGAGRGVTPHANGLATSPEPPSPGLMHQRLQAIHQKQRRVYTICRNQHENLSRTHVILNGFWPAL
jgi:hypothetical protein